MLLRRFALPALALSLAVAIPAAAQTPMPSEIDPLSVRDAKRLDRMEKVVRELRDIVFKGQKSGVPVVVQPADTDSRLQTLADRLGDLEQTLTRVNGSLETTAHELDLTKRENVRLTEQVKALTDRSAALEQKLAEAQTPPPPAPPEEPPAKPTAAEAFTAARALMTAGDSAGAGAAWESFLADYPDSPKAAEARYWYGKTLTARGTNAKAATAYIGAIRDWPKTGWAPDAAVELARSLIVLRKPEDACQTLAEVAKRYPKAPAAVAAKAKAASAQAKCS